MTDAGAMSRLPTAPPGKLPAMQSSGEAPVSGATTGLVPQLDARLLEVRPLELLLLHFTVSSQMPALNSCKCWALPRRLALSFKQKALAGDQIELLVSCAAACTICMQIFGHTFGTWTGGVWCP